MTASEAPRAARVLPLAPALLVAVLFVEGYSSLSIEILGLRRMVPWVGSAVPVTSLLLSVYLAALAAGYHTGGRLAARGGDLRYPLAQRLAAAAAMSAFWLSDMGVTVVFALPLPAVARIALYSVVGIAPSGYVLAQSILLAHACARPVDPPRRAGRVFAVSTAGNVAGSLLTAFVVLSYLGTAAAVLLIVAALLAAAFAVQPRALGPVVLGLCVVAPGFSLWHEATSFVVRNAYADYSIVPIADAEPAARLLWLNRSLASRDDPNGRGWDYVEWVEDQLCADAPRSVLVLGAAGRTLGRGRDCLPPPVFVDIDPAQSEVSGHLLFGPPPGSLVIADARAFLRTDERRWEAVFVDAYSHRLTFPSHLGTVEFFAELRDSLAERGVAYLNVLTPPRSGRFLTRLDRTVRHVFADCRVWSALADVDRLPLAELAGKPDNLVYRCVRGPHDADRAVYADALPRIDVDRGFR